MNRGWSEQGKRYRALEREAAATQGTLYFGHLIYADDSAYPSEIEIGLLRGTTLYVERFDNRPGRRSWRRGNAPRSSSCRGVAPQRRPPYPSCYGILIRGE